MEQELVKIENILVMEKKMKKRVQIFLKSIGQNLLQLSSGLKKIQVGGLEDGLPISVNITQTMCVLKLLIKTGI